MSRRDKRDSNSGEATRDAQARVAALSRSSTTSARMFGGKTEGFDSLGILREGAASNSAPQSDVSHWDTETGSREDLRTTLYQALLDRDTARISEDISGRFESCREQMRKLIGHSKRTYIGVGLTILVAVVIGVLAIILNFVSPRLANLEKKSDDLSSSLVRIETILEKVPSLQDPSQSPALP